MSHKTAFNQNDIIHEAGDFFVLRVSKGFEVYRNKNTHSICVDKIHLGSAGITRAIIKCNERFAKD